MPGLDQLGQYEEAVETYYRLAATNPGSFEPDLATALSNLDISLSDLDRREQALGATEEAVEIYRLLAQRVLAAFSEDLRRSLRTMADRPDEKGRCRRAGRSMRTAAFGEDRSDRKHEPGS